MYNTLGYYMDCDTAICVECSTTLPHLPLKEQVNTDYRWWGGFESWDAPLAIMDSDENDTPTHCAECGIVITHSLTRQGYDYIMDTVLEGFANGRQSPVVIQWLNAYEEYIHEIDDYYESGELTIDYDDAMKLYRLLPKDQTWQQSGRPDLRVHAYLAGWIEKV